MQMRALGGKTVRAGPSDPLRGTGYQYRLAGQFQIHRFFPPVIVDDVTLVRAHHNEDGDERKWRSDLEFSGEAGDGRQGGLALVDVRAVGAILQ